MKQRHSLLIHLVVFIVFLLAMEQGASGQPLVNPYPFAMPDTVDVDTSLVFGSFERAGDRGRITAKDGDFAYPDGERFRIVGTTIRLTGCFPDSITAVRMARRLRALGINTVQFMQFDYTFYQPYTILAPGTTSTGGGLDSAQAARFDFFMHQLRESGIYYGFVFHSLWRPRVGDGIRQYDSTGNGARTPIFFDKRMQQVHREIMGLVLNHVNPHTGLAYKDDPALLYVMPIEESSFDVLWMYTKDVVRSNYTGSQYVGLQHHALMDSLYNADLKAKGYTINAQLESAWRQWAENPAEQVRNGGFEDPFDQSAWTFRVNTGLGAQAVMQYTDTEKATGTYAARILIGAPSTNGSSAGIYLLQALTEVKRQHMYTAKLKLKTSGQQQKRRARVYVYNSAYPYEGYGLDQTFEITSSWKEYSFDFVAKSSNPTSVYFVIYLGMDPGDVYIDDVSFRESNIGGLRQGEDVAQGTVERLSFFDGLISPKRAKHAADFYMNMMENTFESIRMFIRDTLKSDVMLAPGRRTYSARDRYAARNYDFFTYYDFRSSTNALVDETGGSTMWVHAANNVVDKPYVMSALNTQYPRSYQPESAVFFPAYAGLHDWDGIHFSYFTASPRVGDVNVDSNSYWEIFDKSFMLTMLPTASNMLRRYDISPSDKVLTIENNQETYDYPQFHSNQVFSLSNGADGRIGLFRRVQVDPEVKAEESFLPQLEISALSGTVDPSALDAENEQIYFDATKRVLRVLSPNYKAVVGRIQGEIITEEGFIVEQVSAGDHTSVVLSSLTDKPIHQSERNLLVIGARGVNADAVFNSANTAFDVWGKEPLMLEGRTVYVTISAPEFDSCFVTPLGTDARPIPNKRRLVERSKTGRFSIAAETNVDKSPWYMVEFSKIPTSVNEEGRVGGLRVWPNPVTDGITTVQVAEGSTSVSLVDLSGRVVYNTFVDGVVATLSLHGLSAGAYEVLVDGGLGGRSMIVVH